MVILLSLPLLFLLRLDFVHGIDELLLSYAVKDQHEVSFWWSFATTELVGEETSYFRIVETNSS